MKCLLNLLKKSVKTNTHKKLAKNIFLICLKNKKGIIISLINYLYLFKYISKKYCCYCHFILLSFMLFFVKFALYLFE